MDRISALRNVESALRAFEDGEVSFAELEEEVRGTLRTFVSSFEGEGVAPFRVVDGPEVARGVVVVAADANVARERVRELTGIEGGVLDVERVTGGD
jgi:molecular chaperone GrpE (heat shock protein)